MKFGIVVMQRILPFGTGIVVGRGGGGVAGGEGRSVSPSGWGEFGGWRGDMRYGAVVCGGSGEDMTCRDGSTRTT